MPIIEISDEHARRLNEIAPAYLKGSKKTTIQIRWLIDQQTNHQDPKTAKPRAEVDDG